MIALFPLLTSSYSLNMAQTLAQTRLQLQNAESSILFMQRDHAQTLQGLYTEISKLQKKCGELTFKLAMNATSSNADEAQLQNELAEAQETMKTLQTENIDLKAIIDTGYKRIVLLESQVQGYDQKYIQDVRERDIKISFLTKELNSKSDTVAYLTTQLHQTKLKHASRRQDQALPHSQQGKRRENEISVLQSTAQHGAVDVVEVPQTTPITPCITPTPPSDKAPTRVRRPFRRSSTSPVPLDLNTPKLKSQRAIGIQASPHEIRLNVSSAKASRKGLPSRPKRGASPPRPGLGIAKTHPRSGLREKPQPDDYVEFLRSGVRQEPQVVVRAAPEPLPPISSNERLMATPGYPGRSTRHSSQGVHEEVGKIIVSPLGSPEKGWRHKERSQPSNGSEL